jgi:hypothetical protein
MQNWRAALALAVPIGAGMGGLLGWSTCSRCSARRARRPAMSANCRTFVRRSPYLPMEAAIARVMFALEREVSYTRLMSADAQLAYAGMELGEKGCAIASFLTHTELVKLMEQGVFLGNHVQGWTALPAAGRKLAPPPPVLWTDSDVTPPSPAPHIMVEGGRASAMDNAWDQVARAGVVNAFGPVLPASFEEEGPAPAPAGPPVPRLRVTGRPLAGPRSAGFLLGSLPLGRPKWRLHVGGVYWRPRGVSYARQSPGGNGRGGPRAARPS